MVDNAPVDEARVADGKGGFTTVRKGDKVRLANPEDRLYGRLYGEAATDVLTISYIYRWRCGLISIYPETAEGRKLSGLHSRYFIAA